MKLKIPPRVNVPLTAMIIVSLIAMFCMGLILGMTIQQQMVIKAGYEFARGLEGTNFEINVDINETIIVDTMISFFNETININKTTIGLE